MKVHYYLSLATLGATMWSCNGDAPKEDTAVVAINTAFMDSTVKPTEDFFQFVNGKWIAQTEIPGDQGRWGSFNELIEANNKVVLEVLEEAVASGKYEADSDQMKAANFYKIGMDSARADKLGLTPLQPYLAKIDEVKDAASLQRFTEWEQTYGSGTFFGFSVFADLKNSDINAAYLGNGSLGLPDRDYYFEDTEKAQETRSKYVEHVSKSLGMLSLENAEELSMEVMKLETALAEATLTKEASRNIDTLYNKMTIEELAKITPSVDWNQYFTNIGTNGVKEVIVTQPLYLKEYERAVNDFSYETIRAYLKWHMLNSAAPYLGQDVEKAKFEFYSQYLKGVDEMSPRWKRTLAMTNGIMGEAIGKLYVDKVFPPEAKKKAEEMVANIKTAFGKRIDKLEWMSDETKAKAHEKLAAFTVKIGYPDKWKDYSKLTVNAGDEASYLENVMNAGQYAHQKQLEDLGKPVDRTEWGMPPQKVNAYYSPLKNEIVFPAAILQPPFYNYRADEAVNYGGIGGVIGHEISHGFDDSGSRFDAKGNLENWWTEEDSKNFKERTQKLIDQYNAYEPLPGVHVSGEFTLGENIGDLGGINAAYDGLQLFYEKNGRPGNIDGMTPEQRFFISWATIWRTKCKDEYLRTQVKTDPHSPAMYRGNGPLVNLPTFYEAFNVTEADAMYRPDSLRVSIW